MTEISPKLQDRIDAATFRRLVSHLRNRPDVQNIDLMIRTREALAERMRDEIRAIFADTVSALGFTGTLNFQRTLTFELNPTQEVRYQQATLTV